MAVFNLIADGFTLGVTSPVVAGLEDWIYVYNEGDFTETYSPSNPLICTGITPTVTGNKIFKFTGTNNSFGSSSKIKNTAVGPRYTEEVDWNIAGNSTAVKQMIMAAGYGRVRVICVNNFKAGDSTVELFGANNGMVLREADRVSSDETVQGGWKLKFGAPDKLDEPYPPRAIQIAPVSGSYTNASTIAALEALVFTNV